MTLYAASHPSGPGLASVALLLLLGLAGCSGQAHPSGPVAGPLGDGPGAAGFDGATGAIEGLVLSEEFLPVEGVEVALEPLGLAGETEAGGRFWFSFLPPGAYTLRAQKVGFLGQTDDIVVQAGRALSVEFQLASDPAEAAWSATTVKAGLLGCGLVWRAATEENGFSATCPTPDLEDNESLVNAWNLSRPAAEWMGGTFEMEWRSTQAFGAGLIMMWYPIDCRPPLFGEARGRSPLSAAADRTVIEDVIAKLAASKCNDKGRCTMEECTVESVVFSHPETLGGDGVADVGLTLYQSHMQYFTEFYGGPVPEGFTALGDT